MADPIDFTERDRDPANWTREKELAYWNRPYRFQPYPKMLYRAKTRASGGIEVDQRIVGSDQEEQLATGQGWCLNGQAAIDQETHEQERISDAAAERAFTDRRLSPRAQAEAAAVDETTAKHLPEIPVAPKTGRARPRKN